MKVCRVPYMLITLIWLGGIEGLGVSMLAGLLAAVDLVKKRLISAAYAQIVVKKEGQKICVSLVKEEQSVR